MNEPSLVIRPEAVAAKLAAWRDFAAPDFAAAVDAEPRLVELAFWLQWTSLQPGGLVKFMEDFFTLFSHNIGTEAMHRVGKTDEEYTAAERQEVLDSVRRATNCGRYDLLARQAGLARQILDAEIYGLDLLNNQCKPANLAAVSKHNHADFQDDCRRFGQAALPDLLVKFCIDPRCGKISARWFQDLQGALLEMMDAHAARLSQTLALTQIATTIFTTLEFAWKQKAMVSIEGESRFGKTEAVKTWCQMHPGRARLVKTPCDNCDRSLLEAIAAAVGIEVTLKTTIRELKAKVEYVLKWGGLMYVFDEAAWLIPQRYTAKTVPMRLNYVRSQILDNDNPVALVKTPQFFKGAADRFEKITSFNMAQFEGRNMRKVELPTKLPEADLYAVVNIWMPDLKEAYKKPIVAAALISESYLFAVEKISKNARALADSRGHPQIEQDDLEEGIALAGIVIPAVRQSMTPPTPAAQHNRIGTLPAPVPRPPVAPKLSSEGGRNIRPAVNPSPVSARDTNTTLTPA